MHYLEAERRIRVEGHRRVSPGLEHYRLVSEVRRRAPHESREPVGRAKKWQDTWAVDPLRLGIDFADPYPRPDFVQTDEDGSRVRWSRVMMSPNIAETGALDLAYPFRRRRGEFETSGRPRRLEAHVCTAALETEAGIDDVRMYPKLVDAETARTSDELIDGVAVSARKVDFGDERAIWSAKARDRDKFVVILGHFGVLVAARQETRG
jgi:hypothetical protein